MSIQTGDPIPNVRLFELDDQGAPRAVSEDGRVSPLPSHELIRRALSAGRPDAAIIVTEPHE